MHGHQDVVAYWLGLGDSPVEVPRADRIECNTVTHKQLPMWGSAKNSIFSSCPTVESTFCPQFTHWRRPRATLTRQRPGGGEDFA